MENWNDKNTNQILLGIETLKQRHESVKTKMIKLYDEMVSIEKEFLEANNIIQSRLKGTKDVE